MPMKKQEGTVQENKAISAMNVKRH